MCVVCGEFLVLNAFKFSSKSVVLLPWTYRKKILKETGFTCQYQSFLYTYKLYYTKLEPINSFIFKILVEKK